MFGRPSALRSRFLDDSPAFARHLLKQLRFYGCPELRPELRSAARRYVDPAGWAFAYLAVGDREQALAHLTRVRDDARLVPNPFTVMSIRQNAWSDPILEDPAFIEIRNALGFGK